MKFQNTAYFLITSIGIVTILIYGQSLIIPFVLGLLFWFIMRGTKATLDKIPFVRKKFPSWLKGIIASLTIILVIGFIFNIISANIKTLSLSYKTYEANVDTVIHQINETLNLNIRETVQEQAQAIDFGNILGQLLNSLTDLIGNTFMILLYAIFILLEETQFGSKMTQMFATKEQQEEFFKLMAKIESSISNYFRLKTLVSLITGGLSYLALLIIGVDSPAFWAFLIFVLNFIPTIGSLVATIFPTAFSLLQFGELSPAIIVLIVVGTIQVLVGNILEPRLMGSSMNISPLVTILALSLWGAIWGVTGMILSVPITVVMIIVFSQFEGTRKAAILLSEKGLIGQED